MATEVARSLKEINGEIQKLDNNISALQKENKSLDKSLKMDPSNATLMQKKMDNLKTSVELARKKVDELRKAERKLQQEAASGKNVTEEYDKLKIKIAQAEAEVNGLNAKIKATNDIKLNKIQSGLSSLSRGAIALLTAFVALETQYAQTGNKISKASDKFNISAEEFQYGSHIFDKTTNSTDGYSRALTEMAGKLSQVERGSAKTIKAFEELGISTEDLAGLGAAEALDLVIEKLSKIEDADERATAAGVILSSSGLDVAMVAGLESDAITALNEELEANGILTQDQADKAAYLNDRFTDLKYQINSIVADSADELIPAMESLISIAASVISIVAGIVRVFNIFGQAGQTVFVIILLVVAILPKLIAGIKAVNTVLTLLNANPINIKIMLICTAVALLIIFIVKLAQTLANCFGKKYDLDVDTSSLGVNTADLMSDVSVKTNEMNGVATSNNSNSNTVNNYYDYSTTNVEAHTDADINTIAEQLSTKIRVGG